MGFFGGIKDAVGSVIDKGEDIIESGTQKVEETIEAGTQTVEEQVEAGWDKAEHIGTGVKNVGKDFAEGVLQGGSHVSGIRNLVTEQLASGAGKVGLEGVEDTVNTVDSVSDRMEKGVRNAAMVIGGGGMASGDILKNVTDAANKIVGDRKDSGLSKQEAIQKAKRLLQMNDTIDGAIKDAKDPRTKRILRQVKADTMARTGQSDSGDLTPGLETQPGGMPSWGVIAVVVIIAAIIYQNA